MRIKNISLAMLATVFAASCSNEQIVETNADPIGEAIDFRPSVASPTRAVVTTLNNLGDFNVLAKGYHSTNNTLYRTFMIGEYDEDNNLIPGYAEKSSGSMWKLTENVYWPTDVKEAVFWAFADRTTNDVDDNGNKIKLPNGSCVTCGTVIFNATTGPEIVEYKPLKADLSKPIGQHNGWFDGDSQRDLVSAFTFQNKNPHVNLTFKHLLSQIEINAMSKHTVADVESRNVKIRGAWIVNATALGNLSAGFNTETKEDTPTWKLGGSKESYGTYYAEDRKIQVSLDGKPTINVLGTGGHGNLMLVPQSTTSWTGSDATTTNDAYLLLLCRVDLGHKGDVTVNPDEEAVSPTNKDGVHYHQQFPVMTRYDENAYGLTAVPLPINWERGKKYTYNLNICGENTGAGQYPPNIPTTNDAVRKYLEKFIAGDFKVNGTGCDDMEEADRKKVIDIITTIPEGKTVGSYVLDDPIDFTVTVSDWADGGTWTNGGEANDASEE